MKLGAVILFIGFWVVIVAFLSWKNGNSPDLSNYERNQAEGDPCEYGISNPWSFNC